MKYFKFNFYLEIKINVIHKSLLTLKVLGLVFIKTASKQPLFKARWIVQNWSLF
jgi:hypothetical protein